MSLVQIREFGARSHSIAYEDKRLRSCPSTKREVSANGPVIVLVKDGKRLDTPEVIPVVDQEPYFPETAA